MSIHLRFQAIYEHSPLALGQWENMKQVTSGNLKEAVEAMQKAK